MLNNNYDNSSSSEDEITKAALQEATDHQLFQDSYFFNTNFNELDVSKKSNKQEYTVSLRTNLGEEEHFSNFNVSPTFQSYVAKKLHEIVERSISIKKKKKLKNDTHEDHEEHSSGIKLFNSSTEFLTAEEETDVVSQPQKKRRLFTTINEKQNFLMCKQVAVDPEHILSKVETNFWTSKRKEPEFKYKRLNSGILLETI